LALKSEPIGLPRRKPSGQAVHTEMRQTFALILLLAEPKGRTQADASFDRPFY
jgi:hypothetical protein